MKTMLFLLVIAILTAAAIRSVAQSTEVNFQGRLDNNGSPANGTYDLTFALFSTAVGGGPVTDTQTNVGVAISNGLFAVLLDFGTNVFNGAEGWLEIGVRTNGGENFTTLAPRQKITSTPYAITSRNVTGTIRANQLDGALGSAQLNGVYSEELTLSNPGNSFSGSGAGLFSVNAATLSGLGASSFWQLGGNTGTSSGTHFLGTTDNQSVEIKVNGQRALRLEPTTSSPNVIGGSAGNEIVPGVVGAVIAGGGGIEGGNLLQIGPGPPDHSTISGGSANQIAGARFSVIGGGSGNSIASGQYSGSGSAIGGGKFNRIEEAQSAVIAGGEGNKIDFLGGLSTIGGGWSNYIAVAGQATIGGGSRNAVYASRDIIGGGIGNTIWGTDLGISSYAATIGGGSGNTVDYDSSDATIGGGSDNNIGLFARLATIGGGRANAVEAFARGATIPGGIEAKASSYGQMAYASGSFGQTGDAQASMFVLRGTSTSAGETELFLDGASARMSVPTNATWGFDILIVGRAASTASAFYIIRGIVENNSGTMSLIGTPTKDFTREDNGNWDTIVDVDDSTDSMVIRAVGSEGDTVRWVANVRTVEVVH